MTLSRANVLCVTFRKRIGVAALSGAERVTHLARRHGTSRKFVRAQRERACHALELAVGADRKVLGEEYLAPLRLSVNALAMALGVPAMRIHEIVKERRGITTDTAERLAHYSGGDAASWLALQADQTDGT